MLTARDVLFGVCVPLAWSSLVLMITWLMRRRSASAGGDWALPLAVGGGFVLAFCGVAVLRDAVFADFAERLPAFPPNQVADWLLFIALALTMLGVVDGAISLPRTIRWPVAAASLATIAWLTLAPLPDQTLGPSATAFWVLAVAAMSLAWWILLQPIPGESVSSDRIVRLNLSIVAAATGVVLMLSGSQLLGQLGGALAAAAAPAVFIGRGFSLLRRDTIVLVGLAVPLILCGRFYAYLAGRDAILLVAAALGTAAGNSVLLRSLPAAGRWSIGILVVVVPAGLAVLFSALAFAESMSDYY